MAGTPDVGDVGKIPPEPGEKGVRFVAPPDELIPKIRSDIQRAIDDAGGADLALVAVADRKGGWNSALVANVGDPADKYGSFGGVTWIGKDWGRDSDLDWGAKVIWTKNFKRRR